MKNFSVVILLFFAFPSFGKDISPFLSKSVESPEELGKRGWMVKVGFNQQQSQKWLELGLGRINVLSYMNKTGKRTFATGAAAFTFGSDIGFGDTSLIYAAKMGVEAHLTLFGARVTYGYYLQDKNASGVIGIEGGICIFSVVYFYAGYNFVKGNQDNPVVTEGGKLALGINVPFGMRNVERVKSLGQ